MNPVPGRCPICQEDFEVTQLHCRQCDTTLTGHFSLGRFERLSPEALHFAETFIRCEGKINRVGEELEISYPTVRSRLHGLIEALGYEVKDDPAEEANQNRQAILDALAAGEISAQEAASKLVG